jgi:hypothetical protein
MAARAESDYRATINEWMQGTPSEVASRSPLAALIELIRQRWGGASPDAFEAWLEMTAVDEPVALDAALEAPLGTLDAIFLAALTSGGRTVMTPCSACGARVSLTIRAPRRRDSAELS